MEMIRIRRRIRDEVTLDCPKSYDVCQEKLRSTTISAGVSRAERLIYLDDRERGDDPRWHSWHARSRR